MRFLSLPLADGHVRAAQQLAQPREQSIRRGDPKLLCGEELFVLLIIQENRAAARIGAQLLERLVERLLVLR